MGWYVRRSGANVGPVDDATVALWVSQGMTDAYVCLVGAEAWTHVMASQFAQHAPAQAPARGGGCSPLAIGAIALVVLFGGCTFIVQEPVVSLAIFFVGIPFVIFVLWAAGALLTSQAPRR